MSERTSERQLGSALEAARREQAASERYSRLQREATGRSLYRRRPREFDESGFPVARRQASILARVARLLTS